MEKKIQLNRIVQTDIISFLNDLPDEFADLIVADPPYNQNIAEWDTFGSSQVYFEFMVDWLKKAYDKLKINGSIYLFNNVLNSALLLPKLLQMGFIYQSWIVWYKKDGFKPSKKKYVSNQEVILFLTKSSEFTFNYDEVRIPYLSNERILHASKKGILKNGKRWFPNSKGKLCTDVWEISSERHNQKIRGKTVKLNHPTTKPKIMIERIIKASSNKEDVVLDLFSGSGMTSKVCSQLKRNYIGCEKNPIYVKQAEKFIKEI